MKKLFIILLIIISSTLSVFAQKIITNTVYLDDDPTEYIYRQDTFYVKEKIIVWDRADNQRVLYMVTDIYEIIDNIYVIYCNTQGKKMDFLVDFNDGSISFGGLTFYSSYNNYHRL